MGNGPLPCSDGSDLRRQALGDPADLHDDEEVDVHLQPEDNGCIALLHDELSDSCHFVQFKCLVRIRATYSYTYMRQITRDMGRSSRRTLPVSIHAIKNANVVSLLYPFALVLQNGISFCISVLLIARN